jgi:hypothetical protein
MTVRTFQTPLNPELDGKPITAASLVPVRLELVARGEAISSATGFVDVSPQGPVLVTNRHVFTGRHQHTGEPLDRMARLPDQVRMWFRERSELRLVGHTQPLFDEGLAAFWLEHPSLVDRADVACLPLVGNFGPEGLTFSARPAYIPPLPKDDPPLLPPTTSVAIVGFPFAKHTAGFPVWTTGTIASEEAFPYDGLPVLLVDSRTRPGQSGSPVLFHSQVVFSAQGMATYPGPVTYFLGVYSGRIAADSDIGMVWRTDVVDELLRGGVRSRAQDPDGLRNDAGDADDAAT